MARRPAPCATWLPGAATVALAGEAELPAGHPRQDRPFGTGPDETLPDAVVGFAPLGGPGPRRYVRVELPAGALAAQRRAIYLLSVSVLSINSALVLLVLFFLRHLLAPWETLLARAREVGSAEPGGDEVELILATFERAVAALGEARGPTAEEDIAALERTLSASLQSGLLLLDRSGGVLALNTVGAALLGTEVPVPGSPLERVLAGQPELLEVLAAALAEGAHPSVRSAACAPAARPSPSASLSIPCVATMARCEATCCCSRT